MLFATSYKLIVFCRSRSPIYNNIIRIAGSLPLCGIPSSRIQRLGSKREERQNPGEMPELAEGARLEIVCA
jgi:hypothetical protein